MYLRFHLLMYLRLQSICFNQCIYVPSQHNATKWYIKQWNYENNVPSQLSPQWLCGNSFTWAHNVWLNPQSHCGDNQECTLFSWLHVYYAALQIRAGQRSIATNFWPLTAHINHVMIIVTGGFSKKSFFY